MIDAPNRSASASAIADLPAAVGPQITRSSSTRSDEESRRSAAAETSLDLVPRQADDRGPPVHVVGGERRASERDEERAHLACGELVAGLDRGLHATVAAS